MSCRHIQTHLDEFRKNRLSPGEKEIWIRHFEECSECRQALNQENELVELLGKLKTPMPDEAYWDQLENSILARTVGRDESIVRIEKTEKVSYINLISRYLIPLAATIILLLGSFMYADTESNPLLESNRHYTQVEMSENVIMESESHIFATITAISPGSIGQQLIISGSVWGVK